MKFKNLINSKKIFPSKFYFATIIQSAKDLWEKERIRSQIRNRSRTFE
jgi:hypothetical protein